MELLLAVADEPLKYAKAHVAIAEALASEAKARNDHERNRENKASCKCFGPGEVPGEWMQSNDLPRPSPLVSLLVPSLHP